MESAGLAMGFWMFRAGLWRMHGLIVRALHLERETHLAKGTVLIRP